MESEARKLFCHVRDCAQALRDEPLKIARMREACVLRARSGEPHGKGGEDLAKANNYAHRLCTGEWR